MMNHLLHGLGFTNDDIAFVNQLYQTYLKRLPENAAAAEGWGREIDRSGRAAVEQGIKNSPEAIAVAARQPNSNTNNENNGGNFSFDVNKDKFFDFLKEASFFGIPNWIWLAGVGAAIVFTKNKQSISFE
jgi:hypothetical protein